MLTLLSWIHTALSWIGWLGIGIIPLAAAAAVIWFFPSVRNLAIAAAAVWLAVFSAYTYGDHNGADRVREEWRAAEQRAIERGSGAREQSEQEVPPVVEDPTPAPQPGSVTPVPRPRAPMPAWMRNDPDRRNDR